MTSFDCLSPSGWINPEDWTADGRKYFYLTYTCANYNDTTVSCIAPNWLKRDCADYELCVTSVSVRYVGQIAATLTAQNLRLPMSQGLGFLTLTALPNITTAVGDQTVYYGPLESRGCLKGSANNTSQWLIWSATAAGYAAIDDIYVRIQGYIETRRDPTLMEPMLVPQPVSLEAYKWPLQRR